jgi:hypothetical protein
MIGPQIRLFIPTINFKVTASSQNRHPRANHSHKSWPAAYFPSRPRSVAERSGALRCEFLREPLTWTSDGLIVGLADTTVYAIFDETLAALGQVLDNISFPKSAEECVRAADKFQRSCQSPLYEFTVAQDG